MPDESAVKVVAGRVNNCALDHRGFKVSLKINGKRGIFVAVLESVWTQPRGSSCSHCSVNIEAMTETQCKITYIH